MEKFKFTDEELQKPDDYWFGVKPVYKKIAIVGIVLVFLKLFNIITWSWWLVTAPFSLILLIAILVYSVVIIVGLQTRNDPIDDE